MIGALERAVLSFLLHGPIVVLIASMLCGMTVLVPVERRGEILARLRAELAAEQLLPDEERPKKWREIARPEQLPPEGEWSTWYLTGGRGTGKTRGGSEAFAELILATPPGQWGIVAPTFADARDTCVEDESGLLRALGPHVRKWNRSNGELYVDNGSLVRIDGADDGALRVQGKNLRGVWCDEPGLWKNAKGANARTSGWRRAWYESIAFAVRKSPAKLIITGTPKAGHPLPVMLINNPRVIKSARMKTLDNAANLDPKRLTELIETYEGTQLGRQELLGEVIEDVEGAMWTRAMIEDGRIPREAVCFEPDHSAFEPEPLRQHYADLIHMTRIVVAVDPAVSIGEDSDETGIGAAGVAECDCRVADGGGIERHGFVLADRSGRLSPRQWAAVTAALYDELAADKVLGEKNNGGDLVESNMNVFAEGIPFESISASRGKALRAQPVAQLYEHDDTVPWHAGKVHHVGPLPLLEDQMCNFIGDGSEEHDDRVDWLVYALTDLLVGGGAPRVRWI